MANRAHRNAPNAVMMGETCDNHQVIDLSIPICEKGRGKASQGTKLKVDAVCDEYLINHRVLSSARIASFNSSNGANSFLSTRSNCTSVK
jgi:hypothetical protein